LQKQELQVQASIPKRCQGAQGVYETLQVWIPLHTQGYVPVQAPSNRRREGVRIHTEPSLVVSVGYMSGRDQTKK